MAAERVTCVACAGVGLGVCVQCSGRQVNASLKICDTCKGRGLVVCTQCDGAGFVHVSLGEPGVGDLFDFDGLGFD